MNTQIESRAVQLEKCAESRALHFERALRQIMSASHDGGPAATARMYDIARTALAAHCSRNKEG